MAAGGGFRPAGVLSLLKPDAPGRVPGHGGE